MGRVTRHEARLGADRLSVRLVAPPGGTPDRGTVFVPPLIGGSGLQQIGYFRDLSRAGYRLATFDYRGHGKSTGRFCIRNTIEDARAALDVVRGEHPDPLLGVADCYGCIPLLRAAQERPDAFRALALFNPIPSLQFVASPRTLLANYFRPEGRLRLRNPLDLYGMLAATNERLFPHVDKSRDHFGILDYARADFSRALREYLFLRPLDGVVVPVPALVGYGRTDGVLGLDEPNAERAYRKLWERHLPNLSIRALEEVDHYWTGAQEHASRLAAAFFEEPRSARALRPAPRRRAQREPGEEPEWNHQLGGRITSSGL